MAVDDSGKRARLLPCLAILRYTVATVVTVLAVVVIVMVIAVGVRPGDVSVSVVQGRVTVVDCIGRLSGARVACSGFGGGRDFISTNGSVIYSQPLEALSLEVILSVDNPGGRGTIYCRSINVSFHAGTAATGMKILVWFPLPINLDFHVKPQTSHKIFRVTTINKTRVLNYIANSYGGESSFTGTVEVTMDTFSVVLGHHTAPSIVKFVCSPLDFSVFYATDTATSVQCAKSS